MHRHRRFPRLPRRIARGRSLQPSDLLLGGLALLIARLIGW